MRPGTFNIQLDRALASKLRVSGVPAIIAIVGGKPRHYNDNDISLRLIRDFIRRLIPEDTITKVQAGIIIGKRDIYIFISLNLSELSSIFYLINLQYFKFHIKR